MEENKILNEAPKPGTKAALEAENEALKAQLEAMMAQQEARKVAPAEAPRPAGPKLVTIRIPKTKDEKDDVFVSVNFRTYQIQRGVEVEVPDFVAEVLRHREEMLEQIMLFEERNQH